MSKVIYTVRVNEAVLQSLVNFYHFSRSKKYKCILLPLLHVNLQLAAAFMVKCSPACYLIQDLTMCISEHFTNQIN